MRISDWSSDVCSSDLLIAGMKGSQIVADDPDDTAGLSEVLRGLRDHGAFARAGLASQDDGGGRLDGGGGAKEARRDAIGVDRAMLLRREPVAVGLARHYA